MHAFKKILKWAGFVAIFLALFAFTIVANKKRSGAAVSAVNVEFEEQGVGFVQEEDILKFFPQADSLNFGKMNEIELKKIENEVLGNEYVENSHAFINNREQLTLKVSQKEPLFRVFHGNGVHYYVDRTGKKFPISPTFTANVPLATGKIIYDVDSLGVQQGQAINDLIMFFEFVNEEESLKALVSRVDVRANGDLVFTPRMGQHVVNVGRPTELEDKMNRLTIFYKEGLNKLGWDKYKEVSLKYRNQIIAKKKEE